MKMTDELAQRIEGRTRRVSGVVTDALRIAVVVDWCDGITYKEIMAKHHISKTCLSKIVRDAKAQATAHLAKNYSKAA